MVDSIRIISYENILERSATRTIACVGIPSPILPGIIACHEMRLIPETEFEPCEEPYILASGNLLLYLYKLLRIVFDALDLPEQVDFQKIRSLFIKIVPGRLVHLPFILLAFGRL